MSGKTNLKALIKHMNPVLNKGEYVFTVVENNDAIPKEDFIGKFIEKEGITLILERSKADKLNLPYTYIASWITLKVHSSLSAVGLTASFSSELAKHNISCNVMAGYYHDHIFVDMNDANKAVEALKKLSKGI